MQIFIDDSGSFSWSTPDISLFCGLMVPDRKRQALFDRFAVWRTGIIGDSSRELKGSELSDAQLRSFVKTVFSEGSQDAWLTVTGIDTAQTRKEIVEQLREQAGALLERSSEIMAEHNNARMKENYRQNAGWMRSRSPENLLWIIGLEEAVIDSVQMTILRFMRPEDDSEFKDMRILIDESFIRKEQHVNFWKEWLRNGLAKSSRTAPLMIPNTWRPRNHPFLEDSTYPGIVNLKKLYWHRLGFFRSKNFIGLQIADICAHTICRYHRGRGARQAYRELRFNILCEDGAELHRIIVDERSLHKDDPRTHAGIWDEDEFKRRADAMRSKS